MYMLFPRAQCRLYSDILSPTLQKSENLHDAHHIHLIISQMFLYLRKIRYNSLQLHHFLIQLVNILHVLLSIPAQPIHLIVQLCDLFFRFLALCFCNARCTFFLSNLIFQGFLGLLKLINGGLQQLVVLGVRIFLLLVLFSLVLELAHYLLHVLNVLRVLVSLYLKGAYLTVG